MKGCRPLLDDEIPTVLASIDGAMAERNRALVAVGLSTGFRVSELLSLTVECVLGPSELRRVVRLQRRHTKGRQQSRTAFLAEFSKPILSRWLEIYADSPFFSPTAPLFPSQRRPSEALSRFQAHRIITAAFHRAGIFGPRGELGTHVLRKTHARKVYEATENIFIVQKALGHASPASTVAYLSFDERELEAAHQSAWAEC